MYVKARLCRREKCPGNNEKVQKLNNSNDKAIGSISSFRRFLSFFSLVLASSSGFALSFGMLGLDLFFEDFFVRGIWPWLHTVVALAFFSFGGAVLLYAVTREFSFLVRQLFRLRTLVWTVCLIVVIASSYLIWERFRPLPAVPGASRESVAYLQETLWYLERYSIRSEKVDWPKIRHESFEMIEGVQTSKDTYWAIHHAIVELGDKHTQLLLPDWRSEPVDTSNLSSDRRLVLDTLIPDGRLTKSNVGYIMMPRFDGVGSGSIFFLQTAEKKAYVDRVRDLLHEIDEHHPCGWIIDLRRNPGGNVWPMLDALAPLIGEGRVFSMEMPQFGRRSDTWIIAGRASSGAPMFGGLGLIGPSPLKINSSNAPVAILIGPFTASSGEALLVSFLGRPNTRTFGQPTYGAPTATQGVSLPDGAELIIGIGRDVDRTGQTYEDKIEPDEQVTGMDNDDESAAIVAASRWVRSIGGCADQVSGEIFKRSLSNPIAVFKK